MSVRTQPFTAQFTRVIVSLAWTLILISLAGCSVGDFIGAYFNTYYNAQRLFSEAEEELSKQSATRQTEKVFLAPIAVPAATKTKLTSVIEKCSKLLQYHPESELVDDALMMIGKSYYYQNEHQKAERKFREILDGYPGSDLAFEAKLLLSYTLYRMNDMAKAANVAKELVDTTKLEEPDIAANASVLLAEIERENENYEEAISHYQKAAELGESADGRTDSYMKLAELYSLKGDDKSALEAYRRAEESSTSYSSKYQARMGQARKLSKLGNFEAGFELLDDLRSNSNNKDFFGEIELEIGNVFKTMNDVEAAIAQYVYVDTTYARTEASANSYYQLGHLYETILVQYDSARIAYNKGKTEFPQARITESLVYRSEYLNKYYTFQKEISKYDSLRALILNPPVITTPAQNENSTDSSAATSDTSALFRPERPAPRPELTPSPNAASSNTRLTHGDNDPQAATRHTSKRSREHLTCNTHRVMTPLTYQILLALADSERHGYGIIKEIEERAGAASAPSTGALYLALQRMHRDGLIAEASERPTDTDDARRRRYYNLTQKGRGLAQDESLRLAALVSDARAKKLLAGGTP